MLDFESQYSDPDFLLARLYIWVAGWLAGSLVDCTKRRRTFSETKVKSNVLDVSYKSPILDYLLKIISRGGSLSNLFPLSLSLHSTPLSMA